MIRNVTKRVENMFLANGFFFDQIEYKAIKKSKAFYINQKIALKDSKYHKIFKNMFSAIWKELFLNKISIKKAKLSTKF